MELSPRYCRAYRVSCSGQGDYRQVQHGICVPGEFRICKRVPGRYRKRQLEHVYMTTFKDVIFVVAFLDGLLDQ